jgi:hypothetical protein
MGHFWQNIYNGLVTEKVAFAGLDFLAYGERIVKPCYQIFIMPALA